MSGIMSNVSEINFSLLPNISAAAIPNEFDESRHTTGDINNEGLEFDKRESNTNLTFLPSLAFIVFIVLVLLKIYNWYKEGVRRKARGDLEYGDESEVNYGIIKEGDKEFCRVEIRSDTTSVYDTVNSFRLFSNGYATCITPGNHDTVGSYKSLVVQRGDASHYDSVKSYKAFLKQVTQNKDLDVEVKLLENYPVKCKSAEHCVVLEEEGGTWHASKLNLKQISSEKKRNRYRRASGEPLGPMRKRSASNPTYNSRQSGASSLPSIHYSVSSDSSNDEDSLNAIKKERKKAFEDRSSKKMSRSCSGGKLSKTTKAADEDNDSHLHSKRKRHYSADGGSRFGKLPIGCGAKHYKISRVFQHELNNLRESISETDPKSEEHVIIENLNESSSDNPDSSPSPCNSSVSSDAIESESDDETKLVTQISTHSDNTTFNDLASSEEMLSHNSMNSDKIITNNQSRSCKNALNKNDVNSTDIGLNIANTNGNHTIDKDYKTDNSTQAYARNDNYITNTTKCIPEKQLCDPNSIANNNVPSCPAKDIVYSPIPPSDNNSSLSPSLIGRLAEVEDSEDTDNSVTSNPRKVKRFHVTSVQNDDILSLSSQNGSSL